MSNLQDGLQIFPLDTYCTYWESFAAFFTKKLTLFVLLGVDVVLRRDPDASESEASSDLDFDNLAPITPDGVVRDEIKDKDDDTIPYDGHDCGCVWCPDCH